MTKKRFIITILIAIVAFSAFWLLTQAHANEIVNCDEYGWNCEVTPTPTVEVTPTDVPTDTPTVVPSESPTSSPEASVTPGGGNVPSHPSTDTTEPPGAATCNVPFANPVVTSVKVLSGTSVQVSWLDSDTNLDKFSLVYGYNGNLNMGVDNIPSSSTSFTINGLSNTNISVQVGAWRGGCEQTSHTLPLAAPATGRG